VVSRWPRRDTGLPFATSAALVALVVQAEAAPEPPGPARMGLPPVPDAATRSARSLTWRTAWPVATPPRGCWRWDRAARRTVDRPGPSPAGLVQASAEESVELLRQGLFRLDSVAKLTSSWAPRGCPAPIRWSRRRRWPKSPGSSAGAGQPALSDTWVVGVKAAPHSRAMCSPRGGAADAARAAREARGFTGATAASACSPRRPKR
jgi:hypothetical protein